jgi:hypothetical protein
VRHLLRPGDLIVTTGDHWSVDWKGIVAFVIEKYRPEFDGDDEPRWRAMTAQGDIIVFRDEVNILNEHADGAHHAKPDTCGGRSRRLGRKKVDSRVDHPRREAP